MTSPQEDEGNETLGLPPGALEKLLRDKAKNQERPAGPPAGKPAPEKPAARPQAPPAKAPARPGAPPPAPGPVDDAGSDFRTLPPAGPARGRRPLSSREELEPGQGVPLDPWSVPEKPIVPKAHRPAAQAPGRPASPAQRPEPPADQGPDSDLWPEMTLGTALPPQQKKPGRPEPPPSAPAPEDMWRTQWPADPSAQPPAPPGRQPPQARTSGEDSDLSTPVRYPDPRQSERPAQGQARPPAAPPPPARRQPPPRVPADGVEMTVAIDRPAHLVKGIVRTLQFYNVELRRWSDLGKVPADGQEVGRFTFSDWNPNPETLAQEHIRLYFEDEKLFVEPLPTLNGAYLKLRPFQPIELVSQALFRVGRHVLRYRQSTPPREVKPITSDEGEVFQSRLMAPRGFVDLLGPDREPYLSFPLTKTDESGTRIGRGGPDCDIALCGDDWASSKHARLVYSDEKCLLEDLKSTNGTFIQINAPTVIQRGSLQKPDACDVVLLGGYLIRVVEERA